METKGQIQQREHPSLKALTLWQRYQLYLERAKIQNEQPLHFEQWQIWLADSTDSVAKGALE